MKSGIPSPGAVGSTVTVTFCPSANMGIAAVAGGVVGPGIAAGDVIAGVAGAGAATVGACSGAGDGTVAGAGTGAALAGGCGFGDIARGGGPGTGAFSPKMGFNNSVSISGSMAT